MFRANCPEASPLRSELDDLRAVNRTAGTIVKRSKSALWARQLTIREAITYQPASHYWPFQWIETGIFLALAFALAGVCFWRLGRRRT